VRMGVSGDSDFFFTLSFSSWHSASLILVMMQSCCWRLLKSLSRSSVIVAV
jgi:hypothetical protein